MPDAPNNQTPERELPANQPAPETPEAVDAADTENDEAGPPQPSAPKPPRPNRGPRLATTPLEDEGVDDEEAPAESEPASGGDDGGDGDDTDDDSDGQSGPVSELDPDLVAAAKEAGFSDEDVEGFTPDQLKRVTANFYRRFSGYVPAGERQQAPTPNPAAQPPTPAQPAPPPAPQQRQPIPSLEMPELKLELDENEYGPQLTGAIRQINARLAEQGKVAATYIQGVVGAFSQLSNQILQRQVDEAISGLGEEAASVLGRGATEDFAEDSPEYRARAEMLTAAAALKRQYEAAGQRAPSLKTLVKRGFLVAFSDQAMKSQENKAREKAKDQLRNQTGQFTHRVSGRKAAPAKQSEQARWENNPKVARVLRKYGISN